LISTNQTVITLQEQVCFHSESLMVTHLTARCTTNVPMS